MLPRLSLQRRGGPPTSTSTLTTTKTLRTFSPVTVLFITGEAPSQPTTYSLAQSNPQSLQSNAPLGSAAVALVGGTSMQSLTSTTLIINGAASSTGSPAATTTVLDHSGNELGLSSTATGFIALGAFVILLLLLALAVRCSEKRRGNVPPTGVVANPHNNRLPDLEEQLSPTMTEIRSPPLYDNYLQPPQRAISFRSSPFQTSSRQQHPFSPPPAIPSSAFFAESEPNRLKSPPKYPFYIPSPETVAHAFLILNEGAEVHARDCDIGQEPLIDFLSLPLAEAPAAISSPSRKVTESPTSLPLSRFEEQDSASSSVVSPLVGRDTLAVCTPEQYVSVTSALSSNARNAIFEYYESKPQSQDISPQPFTSS
ncbi:hypothetical protein BC830DRAFT_1147442 [Chytriomyces sp. MP71]|nr:hypothetical protein BC830DRAFT_1147442 [Chytriomyces sp. MP71]